FRFARTAGLVGRFALPGRCRQLSACVARFQAIRSRGCRIRITRGKLYSHEHEEEKTMRFRTFVILAVVALMASSFSTISTGAGQQKRPAPQNEDLISGEWDALLTLAGGGHEIPLTLKLKLDHDKVTGAFKSDHLGSGDVKDGSWAANKLNLSFETRRGLI